MAFFQAMPIPAAESAAVAARCAAAAAALGSPWAARARTAAERARAARSRRAAARRADDARYFLSRARADAQDAIEAVERQMVRDGVPPWEAHPLAGGSTENAAWIVRALKGVDVLDRLASFRSVCAVADALRRAEAPRRQQGCSPRRHA